MRLWVLLIAVLWSSPGWAQQRIAVLELAGELSTKERATLTDEVREAIVESAPPGLAVMTRENMEVMLSDTGLDASCIAEGSCEVETGNGPGGRVSCNGFRLSRSVQ